MPDSSGGCCKCCCSFIFTLGLTALFMWLSLRTSNPKCFLQKFYIPALNKTLNPPKNTSLFFELRLENTNKDKGVYYDPINVTFFDNPNKNHSIGNFTIQKFYQGHKKKATKGGDFNASGLDVEAISRAISNGSAIFRVDIATAVRYKIMAWKTKRHRITVGADVNINDQGTQVNPDKRIKLSNAEMIGSSYGKTTGILLFLFYLNLW